MTLNTFSSGVNTSFSTELNENFKSVYLRPLNIMGSADMTEVSLSASTESGVTVDWTTKRTLNIAAGAITDYIIVRAPIILRDSYASDGIDDTAYIRLLASSTVISSTYVQQPSTNSEGSAEYKRMLIYKYSPTSAEKTNGFTIDLDLKLFRGASAGKAGTIYAINDYWEVWGV